MQQATMPRTAENRWIDARYIYVNPGQTKQHRPGAEEYISKFVVENSGGVERLLDVSVSAGAWDMRMCDAKK